MQRLERAIEGKEVAILLHGKSILLHNPKAFPPTWIYVGLNDFTPIEKQFHPLDILLLLSETEIVRQQIPMSRFLQRSRTNLLITTPNALACIPQFPIHNYRNQVIAIPKLEKIPHPRTQHPLAPNTLFCFLYHALPLHATHIHLFGCDGCSNKHFEKSSYFNPSTHRRPTEITRDTPVFNHYFPLLLTALKKEHSSIPPITNHSPNTKITVFPVDTTLL